MPIGAWKKVSSASATGVPQRPGQGADQLPQRGPAVRRPEHPEADHPTDHGHDHTERQQVGRDQQQPDRDEVPRTQPRRYLDLHQAVGGGGDDLARPAEPLQDLADLVLGCGTCRARFGDVGLHVVEQLVAPARRQRGSLGGQLVQVRIDQAVAVQFHVHPRLPLCKILSTEVQNRCQSAVNAASAWLPSGVEV